MTDEVTAPTQAEIQDAIARAHKIRAETMQSAFRAVWHALFGAKAGTPQGALAH